MNGTTKEENAAFSSSPSGSPRRRLMALMVPPFILGLSLVLLLYSLGIPARVEQIFLNTSYYVVLLIFSVWIYGLYRAEVFSCFKSILVKYRLGLGLALLLTIGTCLSNPPRWRVLNDEATLVSTSRSMIQSHSVEVVMGGTWHEAGRYYYPAAEMAPKRPLLFPFILHLVHGVLGYRAENVFLLNAVVLFLLIFLSFAVASHFLDQKAAIAASFLVLIQPIVTQCAMSGGFELFSVLIFAIAFLSLYWYLLAPSSERLFLLWANLVLLAHTRYEALVFSLVIAIWLIAMRLVSWKKIRPFRIFYSLTPLFGFPLLWQWMISRDHYENPPGVAIFSFEHLQDNLTSLGALHFGGFVPFPFVPAVNLLGIALLILFFFRKASGEKGARSFVGLLAGCLVLWTGIFLSYYSGDFSKAVSARFFLPACLFLSLMPLFAPVIFRKLSTTTLLIFSIGLFGFLRPKVLDERFTGSLGLPAKVQRVTNFLRGHPGRTLLIIEDTIPFSVENIGTLDFKEAGSRREELLRQRQYYHYDQIFAVQDVLFETGQIVSSQRLPPEYELLPIEEFNNSMETFSRISRVKIKP